MGAPRFGDVSAPWSTHQILLIAGRSMSGAKAPGQVEFLCHATIISPETTCACSPGVMTGVPKRESFSWQTIVCESGARTYKKPSRGQN